MSEELYNKFNELNHEEETDAVSAAESPVSETAAPEKEPQETTSWVNPLNSTENAADAQPSADNGNIYSDSKWHSADAAWNTDAGDTVSAHSEPDVSDPTPADRVFTNPYSSSQNTYQGYQQAASSQSGYRAASYQQNQNAYTNTSYTTPYSSANSSYQAPSAYGTTPNSDGYYHRAYAQPRQPQPTAAPPAREKKEKAKIGKGAVAAILAVCMLISGAFGFGGATLANYLNAQNNTAVSDTMVIHRVEASTTSADTALVDKSTSEITSEVADSVVEITTEIIETSSFYGQYISAGAGSGVIISEDGYIITNNHVIDGASSITVTLRNGESYDATLVGTDSQVDIALLKIDATGLSPAVFGDSDTLSVGDKTVIIGNPLGTLGGSVTEGIISALDRSIVIDGQTMNLLQTDAAINPGNSGGAMFNGQGELCGIVVAKSSSTSSGSTIDNIGFVIPINNVLEILSDLKEYGYVRGRASTGMTFVDLSNSMYSMYYYGNQNAGVYVYSVENGSNASNAGLQPGDRVISVNGTAVSSSSDIDSIISSLSAGDTVEFELERGNATGTISFVLEEEVPESSLNSSSSNSGNPFGGFGY